MSGRKCGWLLVGLGVTSILVFVYLISSGPVLFSCAPRAVACPTPLWSLLNPLRDRGPERAAQALLRELKAGKAREIFARLSLRSPIEPETLEFEERAAILSWRLVERKDFPRRVELVYNCARADYPGDFRRPVRICVERDAADGSWRVTSYSIFY